MTLLLTRIEHPVNGSVNRKFPRAESTLYVSILHMLCEGENFNLSCMSQVTIIIIILRHDALSKDVDHHYALP